MLPSPSHPAEEPCPVCGVLLEVGGVALFSKVRCPNCRSEVMVRNLSGDYRLAGILGHGGSGCVFRARRDGEDHDVALKVLEKVMKDYEEHFELLRNEAASASMVPHPRIIRVLGIEKDDEGARLVMELMEGGSLHDLIGEQGTLDEEQVLRIGLEILNGLSAVHAKKIIHRDLKPANILFSASGEAKLGDFGLALSTVAVPVAEPHLIATPDYVAPEILAGGRGDERSDIYSFGGCLHHALTGHPPYATDGLSLLELRALKSKPVKWAESGLSPAVRRILARMLNPEPAGRFRLSAEVEAVLLDTLENHAGAGFPGSVRRILGKIFRRP